MVGSSYVAGPASSTAASPFEDQTDGRARLEHAGVSVVESKTHVPRARQGSVSRPRLTEMLAAASNRIGLVVAPAGYGKSTLLAQWAIDTDRPVAWLTLDRDDTDPVRFWAHVLVALDGVVPGAFVSPASASMLTSTGDLVAFVTNQLLVLEKQITLILDDYQEVPSDEIDRGVETLIHHLPEGSTIVVASRHDPGLSVARWRAAERLVEIRQHHLRFDVADARTWLENESVYASPDLVRIALDTTEGWPAAFALAMRAALRSEDPQAALAGFGGAHRHISEYIREEMLVHHHDDLPVLSVAAACPRVCGDLVDHALGTSGGQEALLRLERSGVLLESIDETQTWFRLHRLVAEYVLAGGGSDADTRHWLVRAAEWFAAEGYPREALDLMVTADEHEEAARMINRSWLRLTREGRLETLRRDLGRIAPDVAASSAPFLITRAWLLAYEGRARDARADLERAESTGYAGPLPDGSPSVEAARAVMTSLYLLSEGLAGAEQSARRADELVDESSEWRTLADLGVGYASFMSGDLAKAHSAFDRVLASTDALLRATSLGWNAVIDVLLGDVTSAGARVGELTLLCSEEPALAKQPALVVARAALDCANGNPIRAAADLDECRLMLGSSDPTDKLEVLVWLALAEASIGRTQRAREWIDAARGLVDVLGGSDWFTNRIDEVEARLGPASSSVARDPGLTDRERRILQLLSATHLSQREIGSELGISFNTIKSHVRSIYVKLGATTREEASQIARVQGLV